MYTPVWVGLEWPIIHVLSGLNFKFISYFCFWGKICCFAKFSYILHVQQLWGIVNPVIYAVKTVIMLFSQDLLISYHHRWWMFASFIYIRHVETCKLTLSTFLKIFIGFKNGCLMYAQTELFKPMYVQTSNFISMFKPSLHMQEWKKNSLQANHISLQQDRFPSISLQYLKWKNFIPTVKMTIQPLLTPFTRNLCFCLLLRPLFHPDYLCFMSIMLMFQGFTNCEGHPFLGHFKRAA